MVSGSGQGRGVPTSWLGTLRSLPNDSPFKAILVLLIVCLFASVLVSVSAVLLKPLQVTNEERARLSRLADVMAGLPSSSLPPAVAWEAALEARVIELASGRHVKTLDAATYDPRRAERDPALSVALPRERDPAQIGRRARHAVVYLYHREGELELIVLPVHGQGFGSTLYGYLGLSGDTQKVVGLTFYEHGETPGLGALIEDPAWLAQWRGRRVWDSLGQPALAVAAGAIEPGSPEAAHQVEGLTGATWTSRGVTNLLQFWLGEDGYGPFLRNIREKRGQ